MEKTPISPENSWQPPHPAQEDEAPPPVVVPWQRLSEEALADLARDFILRETGNDDPDPGAGVDVVVAALRKGTHVVVFDPATETVSILDAKKKPGA